VLATGSSFPSTPVAKAPAARKSQVDDTPNAFSLRLSFGCPNNRRASELADHKTFFYFFSLSFLFKRPKGKKKNNNKKGRSRWSMFVCLFVCRRRREREEKRKSFASAGI
jgi:hypothetical protein